MQPKIGIVLVFLISLGSFAKGGASQELSSAAAAKIRSVQESMQANRDAFTEFRVEYEVTSGYVASEEDALKGRFINGEQATATWTRRGDDETYRIIFRPLDPATPPEAIPVRPARNGVGEIEIPLGSSAKDICYVARGDYFASHTPTSKACMINKKSDAPWHLGIIEYNPFGFDLGSTETLGPYAFLKASVNGKTAAEINGVTANGEEEVITISIHGKDPKEGRFRLETSSAWNYLPREYSYRSSPNVERLFVLKTLDAVKALDGHWFPTKMLRISSPDRIGLKKAELVIVKSVKFEVADTEMDGVFEVAAGAQFNVMGQPHFFTSGLKETVSLSNVEVFYQRAVANGLRYKAIEQEAKKP